MKRIIALLLALLLCGCAAQPIGEIATEPVASEPPFADSLVVTERYTEPEDPQERLAWRRDLVVERMKTLATIRWTTKEDIVYDYTKGPVVLKADRIYEGMPYAHGSSGELSFLQFATGVDEKGAYVIEGLDGSRLSGEIRAAHLSNDCADMVFWAWAAVSSSITFGGTKQMTEAQGCIPVGDYTVDWPFYIGPTKDIRDSYGKEHMLGCYAQMQRGDALVRFNSEGQGHAIMATEVHVQYNEDGSVNGEESYALITDQSGVQLGKELTRFDEQLGQDVYVLCGVDAERSFDWLYNSGYLPVTCKELIDPTPLPEEQITASVAFEGIDSLLSGELQSNYRLSHVQMTIYDEQGSVVQKAIGFCQEQDMYAYKLNKLRMTDLGEAKDGAIDPKALPEGTYRCVLTCTVSTGRTLTVRDVTFSK